MFLKNKTHFKKAQISLEILVLLSVLFITSIIIGLFYISSLSSEIEKSSELDSAYQETQEEFTGFIDPVLRIPGEIYDSTSKVATPVANPLEGTFSSSRFISLSTSTNNANIYYTTDDSQPTENTHLYSEEILIEETTTIKARAYKEGFTPSDVAVFSYIIDDSSFDCDGYLIFLTEETEDVFVEPISIEVVFDNIDCPENHFIYYTKNGSEPTEESNLYLDTERIDLNKSAIINAKVFFEEPIENPPQKTKDYFITDKPNFSLESQYFSETLNLELNYDFDLCLGNQNCSFQIVYTLDDEEPTQASTIYDQTITLTETTTVKARIILEKNNVFYLGPVRTKTYEFVEPLILCGDDYTGDGSEQNPYLICTAEDLYNINQNLSAHYLLGNNIDVDHDLLINEEWYDAENGWESFGSSADRFTGLLDGQFFTISNLFIDGHTCFGFFCYLDTESIIKNLNLENVFVNGSVGVGGLANHNYGTIDNISITGYVAGNRDVGGVVSKNYGSISNSHFIGTAISGNVNVGGLVAENHNHISKSFSKGQVQGHVVVGGLVGKLDDGEIVDSYSRSVISGNVRIGGLVGETSSSNISSSFATGSVSGNSFVGGLVGRSTNTQINNSYYDTDTTNQSDEGKGQPRNTDEMSYPYSQNTYEAWDFVDIWKEDQNFENNGYPYLTQNH